MKSSRQITLIISRWEARPSTVSNFPLERTCQCRFGKKKIHHTSIGAFQLSCIHNVNWTDTVGRSSSEFVGLVRTLRLDGRAVITHSLAYIDERVSVLHSNRRPWRSNSMMQRRSNCNHLPLLLSRIPGIEDIFFFFLDFVITGKQLTRGWRKDSPPPYLTTIWTFHGKFAEL